MDALTTIFALILLVASVLLVIEVRPFYSRKKFSEQNPEEESDRVAQREALKEFHRLRRQRDKVWFRVDKLHDEFVQRTSSEQPTIEPPQSDSPPQASDNKRDNWQDVTLAYVKEKYGAFLKKD
jgi:hypothetical protein